MPVSEAQQKAVNKYLKNTFDDIKTRVPKGKREEYKTAAAALGYSSFNNFVIQAIEEKLEREDMES
jgi:predicted HicB family RNase H-like nuclease